MAYTIGQPFKAADFPAQANDVEPADETAFTSTTYTNGVAVCGTTFVAPSSGNVLVIWGGRLRSNTAAVQVLLTAQVAAGGVIGSGTVASPASDSSAVETPAQGRLQASRQRVVTGLTPGSTYNVVTQHKVSAAGNGDVLDRDVIVIPIP